MQSDTRPQALPLPTIRRYPLYLRKIREKLARGDEFVSSAVLADELKLDPVLTRKDLAMTGVAGKPRRGYPASTLAEALNRALGWNNTTDAVLVGVGSLGSALLGYRGFDEQNLSIAVAFDANPALAGSTVHNVTVRPMSDLPDLVKRMQLKLGILTVPASAAQECADLLVSAGVRGIWNFSPGHLNVPPYVEVQHTDLAQSLAVLSHKINTQ